MVTNEAREVWARERVPAGRDVKDRPVEDEVRAAAIEARAQVPVQPQPGTIAFVPNAGTRKPMNAESRVCRKNAPSAAPL